MCTCISRRVRFGVAAAFLAAVGLLSPHVSYTVVKT